MAFAKAQTWVHCHALFWCLGAVSFPCGPRANSLSILGFSLDIAFGVLGSSCALNRSSAVLAV